MRDHWVAYLIEGLLLSILGLVAIVVPSIGSLAVTLVLGWVFSASGIVGLFSVYKAKGAPGATWSLFSALAALIAGGILLWNPIGGVLTLTFVLTAFFIVDGCLTIVLALMHRRQLSGKWEWMMLNGIIDLFLAFIIVIGLPGSAFWVLGLLVGIDLLFGGFSLSAMVLDARSKAR